MQPEYPCPYVDILVFLDILKRQNVTALGQLKVVQLILQVNTTLGMNYLAFWKQHFVFEIVYLVYI